MIVKATVDFGRLCGKQQLWFLRLGSGFHPWLGSFGANNPLDPKTTPFMGENWLLYGEMNSTFGLKNWLHCLRLILIILVGLVWSTETWVDFQSSWLVLSDQPKYLIFDFFSFLPIVVMIDGFTPSTSVSINFYLLCLVKEIKLVSFLPS